MYICIYVAIVRSRLRMQLPFKVKSRVCGGKAEMEEGPSEKGKD